MYREPFCCPVCGGRGMVAQEFYEPSRKYYDYTELNFTTYYQMVPCRACNGTGIVWPPEEKWEITCNIE